MKNILFLLICLFTLAQSHGQYNKYIVKFCNKGSNGFSLDAPHFFLSDRAIERRNRYHIDVDSSDLPVTSAYIDSIRIAGNVTILNISKWLNQISIETDDGLALDKINSYFFVQQLNAVAPKNISFSNTTVNTLSLRKLQKNQNRNPSSGIFDYGESAEQVKIHQADFLHNHGFSGNGMQLAMIDDGFYHYNSLPTFDSIVLNHQILSTWDFVSNDSSVEEDDYHGMHCLSTIAANMPGIFVGSAPKTSFYLFRSEDVNSEYPIEEHNLACAAEKADSLGADVCSISLGYNSFDDAIFDHTYNDMDGNTTLAAKAVDLAAKKGMLMVVAAGNEGNSDWHFINTPADADSCYSVGAVNIYGEVADFSSYGPSSDGQIKPSGASIGWNAIVANNFDGMPSLGNGTSYACPNMAGISTCLWQAFPEANNMEIIKALESSSSKAENSDNRIGFGIPDAKKAFVILQKKFFSNQTSPLDCDISINLSAKMDSTMKIIVERKLPFDSDYVSINIFHSNQPYSNQHFSMIDDLSRFDYSNVKYKYTMIIGNDTTYCIDSSEFYLFIPCNSDTISSNQVAIYPNPASTEINISIKNNTNAVYKIIVVNETGQSVYSSESNHKKGSEIKKINISSLSKGIYFLTVYINGMKSITEKFIKL